MEEELAAAPRLGGLYRAAALSGLRRRPDALPDPELVLRDVAVDVDHLAAYNRTCGFRLTDALPVPYPHVLGFPLALALMTRPDFPLPLVGLVHIANRIEVHTPLTVANRPTLRVRATNLGPHPRGRQVDIVTEAHVDGACAWREHSTYLRRERGSGPHGAGTAGAVEGELRSPVTALWRVPVDVGRRYARVSGDRNPIHTSRLAARAFGFPRRIAHGMWTAARCLAALEGRLPEALTVEVRFQRPVLLPARVAFAATSGGSTWALSLTDPGTGRPHVTGTIS